MKPELPSLEAARPTRRSGSEPFHVGSEPTGFDLLSFWQWSSSEILGNALRGVLAEYIVALDVGCPLGVRAEWDQFDLTAPNGAKIEVKSGAYLQSWVQKRHSRIVFGIQPTYGWNADLNEWTSEIKRWSDVYVFCVFAHLDMRTADPLDLSQWDFYVLPTVVLNDRLSGQKTLALSSLLALDPIKCHFGEIKAAIGEALLGAAGFRAE